MCNPAIERPVFPKAGPFALALEQAADALNAASSAYSLLESELDDAKSAIAGLQRRARYDPLSDYNEDIRNDALSGREPNDVPNDEYNDGLIDDEEGQQ